MDMTINVEMLEHEKNVEVDIILHGEGTREYMRDGQFARDCKALSDMLRGFSAVTGRIDDGYARMKIVIDRRALVKGADSIQELTDHMKSLLQQESWNCQAHTVGKITSSMAFTNRYAE